MLKNFFIDFDGTITKEDVVLAMIKAFCSDGWQEINTRWERGEISTEQCAQSTFNLFKASKKDLLALADSIKIDEYFYNFLDLCISKNNKIFILSDGYDLLIEYILKQAHIKLPFYANKLEVKNGKFFIKCPHINIKCGMCGTCKTHLLHHLKEKDNQTIYIGDGYSDTCVVKEANVVFAKEPLYSYCKKNNINAYLIQNFKDVIQKLPNL